MKGATHDNVTMHGRIHNDPTVSRLPFGKILKTGHGREDLEMPKKMETGAAWGIIP